MYDIDFTPYDRQVNSATHATAKDYALTGMAVAAPLPLPGTSVVGALAGLTVGVLLAGDREIYVTYLDKRGAIKVEKCKEISRTETLGDLKKRYKANLKSKGNTKIKFRIDTHNALDKVTDWANKKYSQLKKTKAYKSTIKGIAKVDLAVKKGVKKVKSTKAYKKAESGVKSGVSNVSKAAKGIFNRVKSKLAKKQSKTNSRPTYTEFINCICDEVYGSSLRSLNSKHNLDDIINRIY
jgi:hypothetical protein